MALARPTRSQRGPYTQESLIYARTINYFHNEINEGVGYNVHQILGPRLDLNAYTYRLRVEDYFEDQQSIRSEWLVRRPSLLCRRSEDNHPTDW